jgi:transposase
MRFVPVKSEAQQAILALHTMRDGLVKARTAQLHQLRAAFYELGIVLPEGRHWCVKRLPEAFAGLEDKIPAMVIDALRDQYQLIVQLSERVEVIEHRLDAFRRSDERCQRLLEVPGVGLMTATSIVAAVGDAKEFRSGREFAAWLGVVPRHSGTGGRV